MKPVCDADHTNGFIDLDDLGSCFFQQVNILSIHNDPGLHQPQDELVGKNNDYFISTADKIYFNALMMAANSAATSEAPPTKPPSTSG